MNQYIIADGERVARLAWNGATKDTLYLHHDRQGSLRMVTSRTGAVVQKLSYDAFGELLAQTGSSTIDYTYTGQDWDPEENIKLFYLRNRYYNPSVGRFVTPDPLVSDLNPYSYANNNPVMMSDPSGLRAWFVGGGRGTPGDTKPGEATYGVGGGGSVDDQSQYYPREGPAGATDQYGNPLFIAGRAGGGGFSMGPSLRALSTASISGELMVPGEVARIAFDAQRHYEHYLQVAAKAKRAQWDEEAGGDGKWRPDSDGQISAEEAWVWYQLGNGEDQSVPLSSLNFSGVSRGELKPVGEVSHLDFSQNPFHWGDANTALVFGALNVILQKDGTIVADGGSDQYDFEENDAPFYDMMAQTRNHQVRPVWQFIHGNGTPFNIILTGSATVGD